VRQATVTRMDEGCAVGAALVHASPRGETPEGRTTPRSRGARGLGGLRGGLAWPASVAQRPGPLARVGSAGSRWPKSSRCARPTSAASAFSDD